MCPSASGGVLEGSSCPSGVQKTGTNPMKSLSFWRDLLQKANQRRQAVLDSRSVLGDREAFYLGQKRKTHWSREKVRFLGKRVAGLDRKVMYYTNRIAYYEERIKRLEEMTRLQRALRFPPI